MGQRSGSTCAKLKKGSKKMKRRTMQKTLSVMLAAGMAIGLSTTASAAGTTVAVGDLVVGNANVTDDSATGVKITSTYEGFNPIIVKDSNYTIDGADISMKTSGDGSVACDFSGYGAAIAVYGDSKVTVKNSNIDVAGVGNLGLFADDGADVIMDNVTMHSDGGTLYAGYLNSPDQSVMVAPPWILGIMGTSRATNLMGTKSSTTVLDSDVSSAQWAVLSTDSGSDMYLNVVNTKMTLTGAKYALQADGLYNATNPYTTRSGYGTYTIGGAVETFYGVDMSVGTYGNILTGGTATYTSLTQGQSINLKNADGEVVATYDSDTSKATTINSDTFGFMAHQGSNTLTVEKGTTVNSGYTSILHKTGNNVVANITSGSKLNPGNGILVQAMDNDDSTTGLEMGAGGLNPGAFITTHTEDAGWPVYSAATGATGNTGVYNFDGVELTGDIFNATGWAANSSGAQSPIAMTVNLTGDSTLTGQVSSTNAIHVTYKGSQAVKTAAVKTSDDWTQYQNTSFTIAHYFDIGQVANRVQSNSLNTIDMNVEEGSHWNVTAEGILNNITLANAASISAETPVTIKVAGDLTIGDETIDLSQPLESEDDAAAPADDAAAPTSEEADDVACGYKLGNVTFVKDTSVATPDPSTATGGAGGAGGPGGMPGGDQGEKEPAVYYQASDLLTLAVKDGVVVAPGTEGASEYSVSRLMYGEADNLSSFSGGGHNVDGDDDYAFLTAIYVKDGKLATPEATALNADKPADDQKPSDDQKPATDDKKTDTNTNTDTKTDTKVDTKTDTKTDNKTATKVTPTTTQKTAPKTADSAVPVIAGTVGVLAAAAFVTLTVVNKRRSH